MADYIDYQPLFAGFGMTLPSVNQLIGCWQEPHRYYHTEKHLQFLLGKIQELYNASKVDDREKQILLMAAFFHDAVYDPRATDNEVQSAHLFENLTKPHRDTAAIRQLILDTQQHIPSNPLSALFIELDMWIVTHSSFEELLQWENEIFKEYQFVDYSLYKKGRIAFLENCIRNYPQNQHNLQNLVSYLLYHRPNIGIYAGSFSPLHNGHLNILEKAERIFDKVIVARGINPEKEGHPTNLPPPQSILRYRQTENFKGLLTDYVTEKEKDATITLVRGLRNGDDLAYEVNQLRFMEDMKPGLKVVFIRCDKQFEHISSSAIRNLEKIRKGLGDKYLPKQEDNKL